MAVDRSAAISSGGQRLLAPGAFRLVLAAVVVLSHASGLDVGRIAVLAFFFLSGYWTCRVWAEKFDSTKGGLWRFYAARYLRIAPLYLIVLAVTAVVLGRTIYPETPALFGIASTQRGPLAIAWSLDIELQFYLIAPLLMAFAAHAAPTTVFMLALAAGAGGVWLEEATGAVTVAKYAPLFVAGMLTHTARWKPSARAADASLGLFVAATALTALTPFWAKQTPDPFDRDIYAAAWLVPLLPWIARSLQQRSDGTDRHLGNLSYPLYLVHAPLLALTADLAGPTAASKLTAIGAAGLASVALYVLVDRPLDSWRLAVTEGVRRRRSRPLVHTLLGLKRIVQPPQHLLRADLMEPREGGGPVAQHLGGEPRSGLSLVLFDQAAQDSFPVRARDTADHHALGVQLSIEPPVLVVDESHAAGHAGREVEAHAAEHHDSTAGHVFAAVGPAALDDRGGARVADGEALAGPAGGEQTARRRAVQDRVADDGVVVRVGEVRRRFDDDDGAGQPLADIVVGFTGDLEAQALDSESPQALPGGPPELDGEMPRSQPVEPEGSHHVR